MKVLTLLYFLFFLRVQCNVGVSASEFHVQIRSGSRDTTFGCFLLLSIFRLAQLVVVTESEIHAAEDVRQ